MVEEKNQSTRTLLAEIEGSWDSSPVPGEARPAPPPSVQDALDAAADQLAEELDLMPASVPSMDELDSGWGDDDDDEEEDEEPEPELPDERLDPVAYAAAKKARDERLEARRQRRRAKGEAKKARRKARFDAQKQKQKGKQKKARATKPDARAKAKADAKASTRSARKAAEQAHDDDDDTDDQLGAAPSRARAKAPPSRPMAKGGMSKTNQWMLAIAILVFLAAATFAAVVAR